MLSLNLTPTLLDDASVLVIAQNLGDGVGIELRRISIQEHVSMNPSACQAHLNIAREVLHDADEELALALSERECLGGLLFRGLFVGHAAKNGSLPHMCVNWRVSREACTTYDEVLVVVVMCVLLDIDARSCTVGCVIWGDLNVREVD